MVDDGEGFGRIEGCREIGRKHGPSALAQQEDLTITCAAEAVGSERRLIEQEVPARARVSEPAVDAVELRFIGKDVDAPVSRAPVIGLVAAERRELRYCPAGLLPAATPDVSLCIVAKKLPPF